MSSLHAWRELAPFRGFAHCAFDPAVYVALPADWSVVIADVVGSTAAIDRGRYTDVNYLGAACIVAVNNALPDLEIPSSFGGDGATLAVPADALDTAIAALRKVRAWGARVLGLELRVGAVGVAELHERGAVAEMAKLELGPGNVMALFRGDGFDLADRLVKERETQDAEEGAAGGMPDLTTLSCRWEPMPSQNGHMLCLIIGARARSQAEADAVYREVVTHIDAVAGLDGTACNPVQVENTRFLLPGRGVLREARAYRGPLWLNLPRTLVLRVLIWLILRYGIRIGGFDPVRYRRELGEYADFRRVTGMLRLVIDVTPAQSADIEAWLESMRAAGRIVYGLHRTPAAIMTCVAPDVVAGHHVHYVDGADGGFWTAARGLKAQLKSLG